MNNIWRKTGQLPFGISVLENLAIQSRSKGPFLKKVLQFVSSSCTFASMHITYSILSLCTRYRSLADRREKKSNLVKREIFICQIRLPRRQIYWREPQHLFVHIPHICHQHHQRCWFKFFLPQYDFVLHIEHEKGV